MSDKLNSCQKQKKVQFSWKTLLNKSKPHIGIIVFKQKESWRKQENAIIPGKTAVDNSKKMTMDWMNDREICYGFGCHVTSDLHLHVVSCVHWPRKMLCMEILIKEKWASLDNSVDIIKVFGTKIDFYVIARDRPDR